MARECVNWSSEGVTAIKDAEWLHQQRYRHALCPDGGCQNMGNNMGEETTTMGYELFREDGEIHVHDPNRRTSVYRCVGGHRWEMRTPMFCPVPDCGWKRDWD